MKESFNRFAATFQLLLDGDHDAIRAVVGDFAKRANLVETATEMARAAYAGDIQAFEAMHSLMFDYNAKQFSMVPAARADIDPAGALLDLVTVFELAILDSEDRSIDWSSMATMPTTGAAFVEWFRETSHAHEAWNHPFYVDFLAHRASVDDLRYYLVQETTLDPRFDDSLALIQIGTHGDVKLEIAGNYWDEMGGGNRAEVHTTLFAQALGDLGVDEAYIRSNIAVASKVSGNLSSAVCLKRRHFYKAIGYFGITEYMGPHRFKCVVEGWRRNRLPPAGILYHDLHIGVDAGHSLGWMHNVISPLVDRDSAAARELARGMLYRLNSSARYLASATQARLQEAA